ncbi:DUF1763-domain-containing protein [Jackrogersella minutella]|nr:DUF1763-domain-containing protein [Jackrogersella minutella]
MTDLKIIHAYRHLYRGLLHAVQFSAPARYIARERLRGAFRKEQATFDPRSVARTVKFLGAAARNRGLEHSILKNLLLTNYYRYYGKKAPWKVVEMEANRTRKEKEVKTHVEGTAYKHYDMTIAMLNKTMGLCLR